MAINKKVRRQKIRYRIRNKIVGTAERPRLSVYRSNKGIYCQLINDISGITLAAASSQIVEGENKVQTAQNVGKTLADKAKAINVENVVFDRGGYLYHGRIKALAEGAREGGLKF